MHNLRGRPHRLRISIKVRLVIRANVPRVDIHNGLLRAPPAASLVVADARKHFRERVLPERNGGAGGLQNGRRHALPAGAHAVKEAQRLSDAWKRPLLELAVCQVQHRLRLSAREVALQTIGLNGRELAARRVDVFPFGVPRPDAALNAVLPAVDRLRRERRMIRLLVLVAQMPASIFAHVARLQFLPRTAKVVVVGVFLAALFLRPRLKLRLLVGRQFRVELLGVVLAKEIARPRRVSAPARLTHTLHLVVGVETAVATPVNLLKKHVQSLLLESSNV